MKRKGRPIGSKNRKRTKITGILDMPKPKTENEENYILCRRDLAGFMGPKKYCGKPIETKNLSNWCNECRKILPIWPE